MGAAMIPLQIASSAMTIMGQVQQGRAAAAAAKAEASRRSQAAKRERAMAQRKAVVARRQSRFAQSNALARMAAAGGGADPTAQSLIARLEGDGELNALDALAGGDARASDQEFAGEMALFRGKSERQQANLGALSSGLSFAAKYGDQALNALKSGPKVGSPVWNRQNWGYM